MIYKTPNTIALYEVDWSEWLPDGDTINTSDWVVDGVVNEGTDKTTTTTTIILSGGVIGDTHVVTNTITTTAGNTVDRVLHFKIQEQGS